MNRQEILEIAKPILFNTEMVQAILSGRKTVTRRVLKPQPSDKANLMFCIAGSHKSDIDKWRDISTGQKWKPLYRTDDYLYVRETWTELCHVNEDGITDFGLTQYFYKTDGDYQIDLYDHDGRYLDDQRIKWRPSLHMPKEAARIFLKVTNVRVEKLQDIDKQWCNYDKEGMRNPNLENISIAMQEKFISIWNATIKKQDLNCYGWNANPWVWVIEFERVKF